MTAADSSKKWTTLLKRLRGKYDGATASPLALEPGDSFDGLVHEVIYSLMLWEASSGQARSAMRRLREQLSDCNELRVCMPDDVVGILGEKYPLGHERALRLRSSLNDVFHRTHALSLQHVTAMAKRDAKAYLDSLEGLPVFASHRVALVHGLGHAMPVDERLRNLLADEGVTEAQTPPEHVASWLEKHVSAEEALSVYAVLQAWSDDQGSPPKRERRGDDISRLLAEHTESARGEQGKREGVKTEGPSESGRAEVGRDGSKDTGKDAREGGRDGGKEAGKDGGKKSGAKSRAKKAGARGSESAEPAVAGKSEGVSARVKKPRGKSGG